jgi:hypothetical protein
MTGWQQVIRTGNAEGDRQQIEAARAHAAGQGLVLQVQPLQQGGYQVTAVAPYAPPAALALAQAPGAVPAHAASHCQACGRHAPTQNVTFMQNVGLLVIRFPRTIRGFLCRTCIDQYFWRYTLITFFFGWWGVISFFYSLVSIPVNISNFVSSRKLPAAYPQG